MIVVKNVSLMCYLTLVLTILINTNLKAQNFPVYENLAISKPHDKTTFIIEDFKIEKERLDLYPNGFLYGSKSVLEKLFDYIQNDAQGKTCWSQEINFAIEILNQWDFKKGNFNRYAYQVPQLQKLAIVYLFTGNKYLGQFIRGHILQITELPLDFWLHAELRGFDLHKPIGGLETASLSATVALVMSANKDLFSPLETEQINKSLKEKGLNPCLNWLSNNSSSNNWLAVVASGAYIAANYLCNQQGVDKSLNGIVNYVNGSIEKDGSYGEGKGYFDYPISSLFPAILTMNPEERLSILSSSKLRHSSVWLTYPYLYSSNKSTYANILHFGDNSYNGQLDSEVGVTLAYMFKDPLALWLSKKFSKKSDLRELFLICSMPDKLLYPKSPKELKLPLVKTFKNGDSYIRSSWEENGLVLSMKSGNGTLVNYSHQHPEMGSICLGAFGEYLIVSSGSASYRSPLRYQWDMTTKAANTITIDDKNQLFPSKHIYKWNTVDVSGYWEDGQPKAEILQCKSGQIADILVNEMYASYSASMNHVRRSVLFVKQSGYYLIVDRMESKDDNHIYTWRLHLNNRDSLGQLKEIISESHWLFSRPLASVDINVFSDETIVSKVGKGYLHGPTRDYSPGGENEGKLGSSIELAVSNKVKSKNQTFYAIIYPSKKGNIAPKIRKKGNKIYVGKDVITFNNGECHIKKNGKSEKYNLW